MEKYKAGYKKRYWFIETREDGEKVVCEDVNLFNMKHISRFILGNMFPTREVALAAVNKSNM